MLHSRWSTDLRAGRRLSREVLPMEQFFFVMAFLTALFGLLKAAIELYGALRDHEGSEGKPGRRT